MASQSGPTPIDFTGQGSAGNWNDAANWGGRAPAAHSVTVVPMNAVENGSFATGILMLLGQETVTVNGTVVTNSPGECSSFMVCDNATAVFASTASFTSAGGMIIGNDANGTLVAEGKAAGAHAVLHADSAKIGKDAASVGLVTIDGASWALNRELMVGQYGQGTLVVKDGGSVTVGMNLLDAAMQGSTGQIVLESGGVMTVAGDALIGTETTTGVRGSGSLSVSAGSRVDVGGAVRIGPSSTVSLSGGAISAPDAAKGVLLFGGGMLSGYGTVQTPSLMLEAGSVVDATGGTLTLSGAVVGTGEMKIGSGSTLALMGASGGQGMIAFGADATLDLAHGIGLAAASLTGFAAGDSIVMPGVDAMDWNATTGMLTLSDQGKMVDRLHVLGAFGSDPFSLQETGAGAVITLSPSHS